MDGVPSSGNHKINKGDERNWGTALENAIDAYSTGAGSIAKATRALLFADLAHAADVMAWVYADTTAAYNGIYRKSLGTGTGSWTRILDLPHDVITATDAGAGTANAIVATSTLPVSESALILLNVFEANTGAATVAFNGGSALTIKTASGNDVVSGGLVAGMALLGRISGSTFRLVSDQASAAIQAAAEAAQVAAEAALAAIDLPPIAANTMLVDNELGTDREAKTFSEVRARLGDFDTEAAFEAATISVVLTDVVTRGYYAAGDGGGHRKVRIATPSPAKAWHKQSADGAWWEIADPEYDARYFGVSTARTAVENSALLQDAIDAASTNKRKLHIRGGPFNCAGGLYARTKLTMEWAPGSYLHQTEYSSTGAFFTNVSPVQAERAVSDIVLINPLIDLSSITYDVSDTTHSENGIGFARGAERITIWGGHIKGVRPNFNSAGGWGGKAIGLDGGVKCFTAISVRMEGTFYGAWVRGNEGAFSNGLDGLEQTQSNKFIGCHFEDVSLPIAIMGRDPNEDPDYRAQDISAQFIANTYHNGGFAPDVPASNSNRYKGGLINIGEAQNFLIDGFTGWNDDDYVSQKGGWPATGDVIGQGLSGAPCHIINGWGGAGTIRNIQAQGPVEDHWHCGRAFAMGDDAAPTGKVKVNYLLIDNIRHIGSAVNVFSQDDYSQVAASGDLRARMDNIYPYALSDGIVAANAESLVNMTMRVFQSSAKYIDGTPSFIYNTVGNAVAASDSSSWTEDSRVSKPQSYPIKTVADNATISFALSKLDGLIAFSCSASLAQGILKYRCSAGSTQASIYGPASIGNVAVTTGASPAGTASTLTFSFDDSGNMWVNNQRGASLNLTFNQLA
ncbi:MAG: hypothetical protein CTR54_07880 [Rhizobium sp.]|nr:MAG: hypothetical protein CTR54_07880 [Rhizobium sp.]